MVMPVKVSPETLFAQMRRQSTLLTANAKSAEYLLESRQIQIQGPNYSDTDGFHIYAYLRLRLRLTSAKNDLHAARLLEIIQLFAQLADDCGRVAGVEQLEVQGKRGHYLLLCKTNDGESLARLLAFCVALARVVEERIKPLAGDDWIGFSMAADHGRAILIDSHLHDHSGSLISLGPAANAPAKKLNRRVVEGGVADGRVAVNMACFGRPSNPEARPVWTEYNLTEPRMDLRQRTEELTEQMLAATANTALFFGQKHAAHSRGLVHFSANSADFVDVSDTTFKEPRKVQGFAMRVDLDGFTAQVRAAFRANDDRVIMALVARFNEILTYPTQFKDRLDRPMILLPWAGDQANMILLPKPGETYADARSYLAVEAARAWHRQEFDGLTTLAANGGQRRSWRELLEGARWVIGWAGGDHEGEDNGHGYLLVANIRAGERGFLSVSGWGWGRALDAQEADYVRAEDTVLPNEDYHALDNLYQEGFRPLDSRFHRAPYSALQVAEEAKKSTLSISRSAPLISAPQIVRPAARPYASR